MLHAGEMVIVLDYLQKGKYLTLLLKYYFKYNHNCQDLRYTFTVELIEGILVFKMFYGLMELFYPIFSLQMHVWKIREFGLKLEARKKKSRCLVLFQRLCLLVNILFI